MAKEMIDIDKILELNPQVNAEELIEALKRCEEFKEGGLTKKNYGLASPTTKQQAHADVEPAARTSRLSLRRC